MSFPDDYNFWLGVSDGGERLSETDADYVDVIHTDAGVFGIPDPIGHADFYPNGGRALQPGCQPGYLARHQETVEQVCMNDFFCFSKIDGNLLEFWLSFFTELNQFHERTT